MCSNWSICGPCAQLLLRTSPKLFNLTCSWLAWPMLSKGSSFIGANCKVLQTAHVNQSNADQDIISAGFETAYV